MVKKVFKDLDYNNAKMTKRFVSYLLDWYIGALFTSIPLTIFSQKEYGEGLGKTLLSIPKESAIVIALTSLCMAVLYYVFIPAYVWRGQTLGKKVCKIKVTATNKEEVTIKNIIIRQMLGIIILEGALVSASTICHQLFYLVTGLDVIRMMMYIGFIITGISIIILFFDSENRALHDFISNTKVIECK